MPHSSSGFGEIKVDRIYLVETETATEGNDRKLQLKGQESSPPASLALVSFLHSQIAALEDGRLVAITFRDKAERNGYYLMNDSASELTDYQSEVATADWTINVTRMGGEAEIDLQSRLTGAVRQNDFALTGQRWHSPALGHYGYHTGSTNPSAVLTRTGADGSQLVYMTIPANIHPKWGCTPINYSGGRVRITDTTLVPSENEIEGINQNIGPSAWTLSNGLVNIAPTASAGVINIQSYSGGAYRTKYVNIQALGGNVTAWSSATVLRNDFEMCVLRLTSSSASYGRTQLDLTLRRGASFVEGYLACSTSTTLSVNAQTAESNITDNHTTGYITRSTSDANSNRFACGSARAFASHANGGLTKTSSTFLDFFWGATIGGAGGTNDTAIDLRNQYIGALPENTYAVRR